MTTYTQLKQKQAKEVNDFKGIFFAFNNDQFVEGVASIGLTIADTKQIYSIGAGGYIRRDRSADLHAMMDRHTDEKQQLKKEENLLLDALVYELRNHEYCISYEVEPALNALGFTKEDIDPAILKKACNLAG